VKKDKDTKKYIGKDGELLESSWGVFMEVHNAISLAIRRSENSRGGVGAHCDVVGIICPQAEIA
jgi:hypothetical protein